MLRFLELVIRLAQVVGWVGNQLSIIVGGLVDAISLRPPFGVVSWGDGGFLFDIEDPGFASHGLEFKRVKSLRVHFYGIIYFKSHLR
jgi:hypothetical protein